MWYLSFAFLFLISALPTAKLSDKLLSSNERFSILHKRLSDELQKPLSLINEQSIRSLIEGTLEEIVEIKPILLEKNYAFFSGEVMSSRQKIFAYENETSMLFEGLTGEIDSFLRAIPTLKADAQLLAEKYSALNGHFVNFFMCCSNTLSKTEHELQHIEAMEEMYIGRKNSKEANQERKICRSLFLKHKSKRIVRLYEVIKEALETLDTDSRFFLIALFAKRNLQIISEAIEGGQENYDLKLRNNAEATWTIIIASLSVEPDKLIEEQVKQEAEFSREYNSSFVERVAMVKKIKEFGYRLDEFSSFMQKIGLEGNSKLVQLLPEERLFLALQDLADLVQEMMLQQ